MDALGFNEPKWEYHVDSFWGYKDKGDLTNQRWIFMGYGGKATECVVWYNLIFCELNGDIVTQTAKVVYFFCRVLYLGLAP